MKYVDASAVLRLLFREPGPAVKVVAGDRIVSSQLLEVETFRALDRERLLGNLTDEEATRKRTELTGLLARIALGPIDDDVIRRAKGPFPINVRALDAIHVAAAEAIAADAPEEPLEFWTHDPRQAHAAVSRGLSVRGA